jgi:tetratricopeptide (TPR) repeat protein
MFVSSHGVFSELLSESGSLSNITIEKALGELNRLSLIRLTSKTASIHRLLQAVEQDSLTAEDCKLWIERAVQLFNALTPEPAEDVRTREMWISVSQHAETLIEHAQRHDASSMSIAILAHEFGQFMLSRSAYAQAEPLTRLALVISEKHLAPDNIIIAIRLNNLAMVLNGTNRPREAALLLRRAIAISEQSADSANQNHLLSQLSNLAGVLQSSNQTNEAEKLYRRALKIAEEQLGPDDPKLATTLDNFATMLQQTRRFKEAEPLCRKALAIEEKRPDTDHHNLAGRLGNLGMLLQATNRLQEAEPLYRRALQVYERCLLPDDPRIAVSLNNLAGLLYDTQRLLEAEPLLRRALQIDRKSLSSDNCALATHLFNLARLLQDTDRLEEAEPLMQEALSILVHFGASTGHLPPELRSVIHTYAALLKAMRNGDAEIDVKIREVCRPLGFDIFLWVMLDIKRPL